MLLRLPRIFKKQPYTVSAVAYNIKLLLALMKWTAMFTNVDINNGSGHGDNL